MYKTLKSVIAAFGAALLLGCGGGGGGEPPKVISTASFDIKTAYIDSLQTANSRNFTVTGTVNGVAVTGSGTTTNGSLVSTTFEGQPAKSRTSVLAATLSGNGTTVPLNLSSIAYFDNTFNYLGGENFDYEVANSATVLPITARVNDTGRVVTFIHYPSSAKLFTTGSSTIAYSLGADTATSAILSLTRTDRNTSGTITSTSVANIRINTANQLTYISESSTSSDVIININY